MLKNNLPRQWADLANRVRLLPVLYSSQAKIVASCLDKACIPTVGLLSMAEGRACASAVQETVQVNALQPFVSMARCSSATSYIVLSTMLVHLFDRLFIFFSAVAYCGRHGTTRTSQSSPAGRLILLYSSTAQVTTYQDQSISYKYVSPPGLFFSKHI